MPKRKSRAYYSQLAKRQFCGVDSMRSHVDSPRVSLDAFVHVGSPRVSVDATSSIESQSSGSNSSVIRLESVYISFLSIALCDITNLVIQPAAPPKNFDKGSEPVSQEESGPVSKQESEPASQQENELVETTRLSEDTVQS